MDALMNLTSPHRDGDPKTRWKYIAKVTAVWPSSKKTHVLNSWKNASIQQSSLTLPCGWHLQLSGSGVLYVIPAWPSRPFSITSHAGKWLRNLVKTENTTDKIHRLRLYPGSVFSWCRRWLYLSLGLFTKMSWMISRLLVYYYNFKEIINL